MASRCDWCDKFPMLRVRLSRVEGDLICPECWPEEWGPHPFYRNDEHDWIKVRSVPTVKCARGPVDERQEIDTREGTIVAEPGDYVMLEQDGSVYPIAPDKFEDYYEVLDGEDDG